MKAFASSAVETRRAGGSYRLAGVHGDIYVGGISGVGFVVQGNHVRNLVPKGNGTARGILTSATGSSIRGNTVVQPSLTTGQGIFCSTGGAARDNDVINYTTPNSSCIDFDSSNIGF